MIRSRPLVIAVVLLVIIGFVVKRVFSPKPTSTTAKPTPFHTSGLLPGSALADSLGNGRPTLVDFGAEWCPPCQQQAPVLDEVVELYRDKANIVYIDTEQYGSIADSYGIKSIPTQIFFDANGKEVSRHLGFYPLEEIRRDLDQLRSQ
jgi:thioredoxin 1